MSMAFLALMALIGVVALAYGFSRPPGRIGVICLSVGSTLVTLVVVELVKRL
ncbi:MAG: hypothetical protein AB7G13_28765 [Lautropia sp.]